MITFDIQSRFDHFWSILISSISLVQSFPTPTNCKKTLIFSGNSSAQEKKWNENLRKTIIFTSRQVSSFFPSRVTSRTFPLYILWTSPSTKLALALFIFSIACLMIALLSCASFERKVWMNFLQPLPWYKVTTIKIFIIFMFLNHFSLYQLYADFDCVVANVSFIFYFFCCLPKAWICTILLFLIYFVWDWFKLMADE